MLWRGVWGEPLGIILVTRTPNTTPSGGMWKIRWLVAGRQPMNSCFHSIEFQGVNISASSTTVNPIPGFFYFFWWACLCFCFFGKTYSELRISYDKLAGLPLWGFPFRLTKEAAPGWAEVWVGRWPHSQLPGALSHLSEIVIYRDFDNHPSSARSCLHVPALFVFSCICLYLSG